MICHKPCLIFSWNEMISQVCSWPSVRSGTQQAETYIMLSSSFTMFSTLPTGFFIYIQLSVIHHHVLSMITVFLGGGSCSMSRCKVSYKALPSPHSVAHFWCNDKAGAPSPSAATLPAWMFLWVEPFFCRYLVTPQFQFFMYSKEVATSYF